MDFLFLHFLFFLLSSVFSNFSCWVLWPLIFNALMYSWQVFLYMLSFLDMLHSLLLTMFGIVLVMCGGWLDLVLIYLVWLLGFL